MNFFLVERNAVDNVETRLLVGFGVGLVSVFEDGLVLGTARKTTRVSLYVEGKKDVDVYIG